MTISSEVTRASGIGNGATTVFPYGFRILDADDLLVVTRSVAGLETTLTRGIDYTVSGVGNQSGGSVTMTTAPASGVVVSIRRVLDLTQPTSISNQGPYFASVHEAVFDRLTMIDQQQQDEIDRSMKLPETIDPADVSVELPVPVAGKAIGWNGDGTALTLYDTTAVVGGATGSLTPLTAALIATPDLIAGWDTSAAAARSITVAVLGGGISRLINGLFNVLDPLYGAVGDGVTNDTAAIAAAAAAAAGGLLYFPPGHTYITNSVIDLAATTSVWIPAGATVKAGAAMAAVFRTPLSTSAKDMSIFGGGKVDCNFLANIGLHPRYFAHYTLSDITVWNCLVTNVQAGEAGMPSNSYELVTHNLRGDRTTGNVAPLGSRGLWLSHASDCKIGQTIMVGTETGFRTDTSNNDFVQCHAWSYTPSTGYMECCFDDNAFSNRYISAYADTPAASVGRLGGGVVPYGFRFRQDCGAVLVAPVCYNNNLNGLDNTAIAFRFDTTAPFATIIGRHVKGADVTHRWAKDIDINGSDESNLNVFGLESSNIVVASTPDRHRQTVRMKGDFSTNRLQVGNGGNITKIDLLSAAITPTSVSANTTSAQSYTVGGVAAGDRLVVTAPGAQTTGIVMGGCRATAANTVEIVWGNLTAGALTPAAGTYLFTYER